MIAAPITPEGPPGACLERSAQEVLMLREYFRLARPFLVLLAIFAAGRWTLGLRAYPYTQGHHIFSLVTLTLLGAMFYAAFARRWLGYPIMRSVGLGMTLGFCSQLVIFVLTAVSYILGMDTYFNHPTALNAEGPVAFGAAMGGRLGGLVGNTVFAGIAAALGWFFGGALPDTPPPRQTVV
jgi:uncharacterized membrane protein (DUF485 family)